jgi:hypothetical protein
LLWALVVQTPPPSRRFRHFGLALALSPGIVIATFFSFSEIDDGASFRINDGGELRADFDASFISFLPSW